MGFDAPARVQTQSVRDGARERFMDHSAMKSRTRSAGRKGGAPDWLLDGVVRAIRATAAVDQAYRFFHRARCELVLALASEALLDRYNDLAYSRDAAYRAGSPSFREHLFPWEEQAMTAFFPPPPARILIGGAGGGREAFALARRGCTVVAFERSRQPVLAMAAQCPRDLPLEVYRAGYEDLPTLHPVQPDGPVVDLTALPRFDAAIVGWGSFTHLRSEDQRVHTLRIFAGVTHGPVLVSFLARPDDEGSRTTAGRLRQLLPGRFNRDPGNVFDVGYGLFHRYSRAEIVGLMDAAGLTIAHLSLEADETTWPYAIFHAPDVAMDDGRSLRMRDKAGPLHGEAVVSDDSAVCPVEAAR
jgi:hypothetical protein